MVSMEIQLKHLAISGYDPRLSVVEKRVFPFDLSGVLGHPRSEHCLMLFQMGETCSAVGYVEEVDEQEEIG